MSSRMAMVVFLLPWSTDPERAPRNRPEEAPMKIEGSRVLVTGASSGIGAALARRGATVGLVARREERLAEVLADCRVDAPDSRMWVADLGDVELAGRVALEAWDAFGHLDCLVNNAGVPMRRLASKLDYAPVEWGMRGNFFGPAHMGMGLVPEVTV